MLPQTAESHLKTYDGNRHDAIVARCDAVATQRFADDPHHWMVGVATIDPTRDEAAPPRPGRHLAEIAPGRHHPRR